MKIFKYFLLSSALLFPESVSAASAVETEQSVPSYISNIDVYEKAKAGDISARKEYFERLYLGNFSNEFLIKFSPDDILEKVNLVSMTHHEMFGYLFVEKEKPAPFWMIVDEKAKLEDPTALICQKIQNGADKTDDSFLKQALESKNALAIILFIASKSSLSSDKTIEILQIAADLNSAPALSYLATQKKDISKEKKCQLIIKATELDYSPALLAYGLYTNDADMIARAHAQGEKQESTHVVAEILKALRDD